MHFHIEEAVSERDRMEVYRFRYRVYVEEMRRKQQYADHTAKTVCEPLDEWGEILAARDEEGHVVGTVRYNFGASGSFGYYTDLYEMKRAGRYFPEQVSITTKLMVSPTLRNTRLGLELALATFRLGLRLGDKFDFIDCNAPLVSFFERLGYRRYLKDIEHPEYGAVVPMVLALDDLAHFEALGSPFGPFASNVRQEGDESLEMLHGIIDPSARVEACVPMVG